MPRRSPWLSFGRYRYTERLLGPGEVIHAAGWFRTRNHEQRFDETADVRELLAGWKRDRRELLARFDADGDGRIDAQEWEQARRTALEQVRAEQVARSVDADVHVLCRPPDRRRFLLSSVPEVVVVLAASAAALLLLIAAWRARAGL